MLLLASVNSVKNELATICAAKIGYKLAESDERYHDIASDVERLIIKTRKRIHLLS